MRIGIDSFTLSQLKLNPFEQLEFARKRGFEGLQFGGLTRDPGQMREVHAHAKSMNLYSHVSVGSPNPFVGKLSVKDRVKELTAAIEKAADCGYHELGSSLGNEETRFKHRTPWREQRVGACQILEQLKPVLKAAGSRINLEPHGDSAVFELVEMVEDIGPDVVGICLDTANTLCFAEDPVAAARRAAPYTHLTHTKDAIVYFHPRGLQRQVRPVGQGILDWSAILEVLAHHQPDLPLSIEDHKWLYEIPIFEAEWREQVPGLPTGDLAEVVRLARLTEQRIKNGELEDPEAYEAIPFKEQLEARLEAAGDFLKRQVSCLALSTQVQI